MDKGELLFSLQFLPTSCRLTIAVLKAKNLKLNGEDTDLGECFTASLRKAEANVCDTKFSSLCD